MDFLYKISPDALDGPDSSTWEWQEEIGEKIQIETEIRRLVDEVVALADRDTRPVARVLFAEHESDSESDLEINYDGWIEGDDIGVGMWAEGAIRRCGSCFQDEWSIWERIRTGQGRPIDSLREHEGVLTCGCCLEIVGRPISECIRCCNCLLTEKMGRRYGISMVSGGGFPEEYFCSICNDIYPELLGDSGGEETRGGLSDEWYQLLDGTWVSDTGDVYNSYTSPVSDTGDVYEDEYENEDPPENDTEIAKEIKGTISEIGENLFDVKEKITEGEYLKIMNLLQKVTNDVNRL